MFGPAAQARIRPDEMTADPGTGDVRRARARRGEGDKLRSEILDAAQALLEKTSDESAVSIRSVAEAVGITPPSIYLHFADKQQLLIAVCERSFAQVSAAVEDAARDAADALEALGLAGRAYAKFGLEHPEQYRILFMRKAPPEIEQMEVERLKNSSGFHFLLGAVQECMEGGLMRRGDPVLAAVGLWAAVHGVTSLLICKPGFGWPPLEAMIDSVVGAYLRGLGPVAEAR